MEAELYSGQRIRARFWFLLKIDFDISSLLKDTLLSGPGQPLSSYDTLWSAELPGSHSYLAAHPEVKLPP